MKEPNDLPAPRVLEGLVAFRPHGNCSSIHALPELAAFKDDVRIFVDAGWAFAKVVGALGDGQARVCVHGGRLMLDEGRLTVRFHKGLDVDAVSITAARFGVELIRRLPVPDAWLGRTKPGSDTFAIVAKLARHSDVIWAEAELVEAMGLR